MGQAKGIKSSVLWALEQTFGTLPAEPTVRTLSFNSFGVTGDRERTDPATITGSRNPVEAVDGNLNVSGDVTMPIDLLNFPWMLRLAFGAPATTPAASIGIDAGDASDLGDGKVGIPSTAHGLVAGDIISIEGTTNYDGTYTVQTGTTADVVAILATYVAETFDGGESLEKGPWTHVFKVGDTMPSFTAQKRMSDGATTIGRFTQSGLRVSSLKFDAGTSGELTATVSLSGKQEVSAETDLAEETESPGLLRVNHSDAALYEGGSSYADAKSLSVQIDFGLDQDQFVIGGGGTRGDLPEGMVKVTGSLTSLFKSMNLMTKATNGTETSLRIVWTKGTLSLACEIQEAKYVQKSPPIDGPQGIVAELSYNGHYTDGAAASVVVWTLVNNIPSYAA